MRKSCWSAPRVHGWFPVCTAPFLTPSCLPRVCMGGSPVRGSILRAPRSAPRVHGWFQEENFMASLAAVCPACAWVVPEMPAATMVSPRLPRVCMGGSYPRCSGPRKKRTAPRVHGWFQLQKMRAVKASVCPACAWVVASGVLPKPMVDSLPCVCMGGSHPN